MQVNVYATSGSGLILERSNFCHNSLRTFGKPLVIESSDHGRREKCQNDGGLA